MQRNVIPVLSMGLNYSVISQESKYVMLTTLLSPTSLFFEPLQKSHNVLHKNLRLLRHKQGTNLLRFINFLKNYAIIIHNLLIYQIINLVLRCQSAVELTQNSLKKIIKTETLKNSTITHARFLGHTTDHSPHFKKLILAQLIQCFRPKFS